MATPPQTDKELSLGLLNINGLSNKMNEIRYIINVNTLHVMALCETKLDASVPDSQVYIPGFRMWRKDRTNKGGGVALYIQDQIETKLRVDLMKTKVEIIWVEMKLPDKLVLLGCCYRPPDAKAKCMNQIKEMMSLVSKEKKKDILLMGDFNIDWKKDTNLKDFFSSLCFCQIVEDFTRIVPENGTKTCIDHIYTNIPDLTPKSIVTSCSDHNVVTVKIHENVPKWIQICRPTKCKQNSFQTKIKKIKWGKDPEEAPSTFTNTFIEILKSCAPLSQGKEKIYNLLGLTKDLKALYLDNDTKKENKIKVFLSKGTVQEKSCEQNPKRHRENVEDDEGQKTRKTETPSGTGRERKGPTEDELQTLFNKFDDYLGESFPSVVISITPEGEVTTEADRVENLAPTRTGTTGSKSGSGGSKSEGKRPEEFSFKPTDDTTVKRWLQLVCDHVIDKIDHTGAALIKLVAGDISEPISHILNKCISSKLIPDWLKNIKTFRFSADRYFSSKQISDADIVHLMLSYVLDGILYEQVKQFCVDKKLTPSGLPERINPTQNAWVIASERGKKVGAVFLDLNSSFNSVSLDLLRNTLKTSGFSDSACSMVENLFSSRGLPSGSFLAQLLFAVFINDLQVLKNPSAVVCDSEVRFSLKIES